MDFYVCQKNVRSITSTKYRDKKSETTINWNDKKLNIKWPIKKPILSKKDRCGINFSDF